MQHHGHARVALEDLFASFLTQLQFANPADSQRFTGLLLQAREFLDRNPGVPASIYLMSWTAQQGQIARLRTLDENSEIGSSGAFFQGASLARGSFQTGEVYPGDRAIKADDEFSVQIHLLNLQDNERRLPAVERVPAVAIWMPPEMGIDTLIQDLPV
jgi:hypothetical protein